MATKPPVSIDALAAAATPGCCYFWICCYSWLLLFLDLLLFLAAAISGSAVTPGATVLLLTPVVHSIDIQ